MSAENIDLLAKMIVTDGHAAWADIYQKAMNEPGELIHGPQYQKYDFGRYLDNVHSGGLIDLFYCYAYHDGYIDMVDWRGEDEDGQIASFGARRIGAYRPKSNLGVCLSELENLTQYDEETNQDFAAGDYVLQQFALVSGYLAPLGLVLGGINIGWDSYLIFVTTNENMAVLEAIDDHHFTIHGFD